MKSIVTYTEGVNFTGEHDGFQIPIGAKPQDGSERKGVSPKTLALTALAGCTAIDVIMILRKMRIEPEHFSVEAEADTTDEHPKVFKKIFLTYRIRGGGVTRDKVEKAVSLSQDKYCGVSAMLRQAAPIEAEIIIEE
jgi:putative redox protein